MKILGVDPGLSGALALLDTSTGRVTCHDMPTVTVAMSTGKRREVLNAAHLAALVRTLDPNVAAVEIVGAMPGQGVTSMFRFGQAHGIMLGVLGALSIPTHHVPPQTWKRRFRLGAEKDGSRLKVSEVFPKDVDQFARKKDHGRADAALLAKFLSDTLDAPF